ncbi:MAG TPA: type II toxin-antitoxin system HipA family toxin [Lacunisphaera sp.]|nr:type II toxin-antitoxin system HipA family toxin [Lacunisphaera sp.]
MQEPALLSVRYLGEPMAQLAFRQERGADLFALRFEESFVRQGHDLSPLHLPLARFGTAASLWRPGDTPFVGGLPGLIADSLPDAWGERMLAKELPGLKTVLGKLAAIGPRGAGALTFEPVLGAAALDVAVTASLPRLAREAAELSRQPAQLDQALVTEALARGGSTLGGAFPKISTHLPLTGELLKLRDVLVGGPTPEGYVPSILKLTHTAEEAEGSVEYAFWLMAKAAGLRVPRACLVDDGERLHFAVQRFDRYQLGRGAWGRRHVHTLAGLLHKRPADRAIDYEEFMRLSRVLGGVGEAAECFRRIVFNLLATVRDDHGRNHAFLYRHENRAWELAPVYDLNPAVYNQLIALSFFASAALPGDFRELERMAAIGGLDPDQARVIYRQVAGAVDGWPTAAKQAEVPAKIAALWGTEIEQQTRPLRASFR